jgi:lysozyme
MASSIAKPFEGLHKIVHEEVWPYWDPVGYPTIGYGHLLSLIKKEALDKYPKMTFLSAEQQLQKDMMQAASRALKLSPILGKAENVVRWAAITDFCFNCGDGNYSKSTLRRRINEEQWEDAQTQIHLWNKGGGKPLPGLTKRRIAEGKMLLIRG